MPQGEKRERDSSISQKEKRTIQCTPVIRSIAYKDFLDFCWIFTDKFFFLVTNRHLMYLTLFSHFSFCLRQFTLKKCCLYRSSRTRVRALCLMVWSISERIWSLKSCVLSSKIICSNFRIVLQRFQFELVYEFVEHCFEFYDHMRSTEGRGVKKVLGKESSPFPNE